MVEYTLHSVIDGLPERLGTLEADDLREAIGLSIIRLEQRNIEVRRNGVCFARIGANGAVMRVPARQ